MLHPHHYVQAKSLARNHGQMDESGKGYISIIYNDKVAGSFKVSDGYTHFYHLSYFVLLCS